MSVFQLVLAVHIAAGSCALVLLWVPLFARKGGTAHRRVGWVYVAAMGFVAVTALALCAFRLANDDSADDMAGAFLGHVAVLTGKNVYAGMRALRHRQSNGQGMLALDWAVAILLMCSSVIMAALGVVNRATLPLVFALLGFVSAGPELPYLWKGRHAKNEWFFRHLSNMVTSAIAAITAFLVVNAPRFGLGRFSAAVWILPGAVGAIVIAVWAASYRRKFAARAASLRGGPPPIPERALR